MSAPAAAASRRRLIDRVLTAIVVAALALAAFGLYRSFVTPSGYEVRWSTENALDILGFNIYRADSGDGPYTRLTQTLIGVSSDPLSTASYRYLDTDVARGRRYYYKIETIYLNGSSELSSEPIVIPP